MSKTVSKKMLINVMHPEEARVAIVHDGRLMELNVEISGKEQTKGNIYKGVVLRVEPGLQAAFVDIGRAKPGFLQMGELHPDFWQWRDDVPEDQRKRRPRIQEVLRRGQELLVQVEKDERDHKGSALTTYISLPGRYMVIMPGSDSTGISRKVEQEGVRKQLKEIMSSMNIPEGIGYIVRTEAVGRPPEELHKDWENLLGMYEGIKQSASEINGAGEIYRDRGLIIRFIRDYFSDDIDEVVVDSKEALNEAKEFFRETMPKCEKLVKLHKEKRPVFSRFQLEEQIDQIYEKRVALPSGGSLIIEPTEALVSIDVNSGKSSGERGIEDTAYKTNMEAAEEVARQLRLRDLGGLIMIDFIDMRDRKHNHDVEKTLKQALKMDKARVNLGRISEFGIMEMSRQRIAKTLNDAIHLECPHCEGRGKVKSVEAMALSFLRKVHGAAAKGTVAEVHGGLPLEVAYYLLNRKKRELAQIENDYDIEVTVKGKTSFLLNQLELEITKRDKIRPEDLPSEEAAPAAPAKPSAPAKPAARKEAVAVIVEESVPAQDNAVLEGGKKRKRRRKKKKSATDAAAHPEAALSAEHATDHPGHASHTEVHEPAEVGADDAAAPAAHKKRKRRRGRKGPKTPEESAAADSAHGDSPADSAVVTVEAAVADQADIPAAEKSKPKRAARAGKKPAVEKTEPAETAVVPVIMAAVDTPEPAVQPAVKPAAKSAAKKAAKPAAQPEAKPAANRPAASPATSEVLESAPLQKPRRRATAKKVTTPAEVPPEAAAERPKPASRTRRAKKITENQ